MRDTQTLSSAGPLAATNTVHRPNDSAAYRTARNSLLVEEIELRLHIERVSAHWRALPRGGNVPHDFEFVSETGVDRLLQRFQGHRHAGDLQHAVWCRAQSSLPHV
jgi:predicted dithiol-disulfide oxidoreductase (DUF899 family)